MDTINVEGSDAQPQAPVAGLEQDFWWQQETNDPIQEPPDAQTQARSAQDQCMVAGCGCSQRHALVPRVGAKGDMQQAM